MNFFFLNSIVHKIMNMKAIFSLLYHRVYEYNLFIPDEDYDEEPLQDSTTELKHQRYSTRLYILLLIGKLFLLHIEYLTKILFSLHVLSFLQRNDKTTSSYNCHFGY